MKRILFLIAAFLLTSTAIAQNSNYSKFAEELLVWSNNTLKESLPQDYGVMILDNLSTTPDAVNYFYIIKDDAVFKSYKENQVELKSSLELTLKQAITSMASSIVFCLDADKGMCYHYANKEGERFTVSFTRQDLYRILGRDHIDAEYRENIVSATIQLTMASLPIEDNFQMSYGGIRDNCVVYNIYTDGAWADGYQVNLNDIVTTDVIEQNPSIFFHLISLYLSKGQIYSVEDRESGKRSEDKLSPEQLRMVYELAVAKREIPEPPTSGQSINEDSQADESEPIPYQLIEVKPTFMGGDLNTFSEWVSSQIIYPLEAISKGVSGRVVMQFTIERDGSVTNVKMLRGADPLLDREAYRIIRSSPQWAPGKQYGELRRCTYTIPVIFNLADVQLSGQNNGYEWVDLGLSVRWATCNLGASKPHGYGDFYSWGALATSYSFNPEKSSTFNKGIDDISRNPEYDAANVNMKGTWRLPTKEECEELIKNCTWTWTEKNGTLGYEVKSKTNNNSIFLPAAGSYENTDTNNERGVIGTYWTSTPADKKYESVYLKEAFVLRFTSSSPYTLYYNKYFGFSIRAVCD